MSLDKWKITFKVARQRANQERHFESFNIEVDPDEYVLDGIERIWAFHDRSLTYRHACHHSTCGACGMIVNGVEKLTCITPIRTVTHNGGKIQVEPLRNFSVVSDLVVDMDRFYFNMERAGFNQVAPLEKANLPFENGDAGNSGGDYERLVDCIECGLCISACPAAATSSEYFGPGVLAGIQHTYNQGENGTLLDMADCKDGVWRCHSAYECTEVCPSHVNPGWRIMELRRKIITQRIRGWFSGNFVVGGKERVTR